jgi:hypothetical protein
MVDEKLVACALCELSGPRPATIICANCGIHVCDKHARQYCSRDRLRPASIERRAEYEATEHAGQSDDESGYWVCLACWADRKSDIVKKIDDAKWVWLKWGLVIFMFLVGDSVFAHCIGRPIINWLLYSMPDRYVIYLVLSMGILLLICVRGFLAQFAYAGVKWSKGHRLSWYEKFGIEDRLVYVFILMAIVAGCLMTLIARVLPALRSGDW